MTDFTSHLILGIIQGITEFIPISSSGHLVILQHLMGFSEPKIFFDLCLHLGTLISVFFFYHKELSDLFKQTFREIYYFKKYGFAQTSYLCCIIITTFFTGLLGFLFKSEIEKIFESYRIVLIMLLVTGVILISTKFVKNNNKKNQKKLSFVTAIFVGITQAAAIIPGISRSGITIATLLHLKIEAKEAFKYSFFISIPAILGAFILKLKEIGNIGEIAWLPTILASIIAAITGYFSLLILYKTVIRGKLTYFAIYCFVIAFVLLIF